MPHHPRKVVLMGAAGRDFHNFNVFFKDNSNYEVKAFTAFQIPNIDDRHYPPELAGDLYPKGIPIFPEQELCAYIRSEKIDEVVFAYSDVSSQKVMLKSGMINAAGADFKLMGGRSTMIESTKPVISVCAVRTGCGKSQTTRAIAAMLKAEGKRIAVVRHPMPYGNLLAQRCQRFETRADLHEHRCTIEEREEYESYVDQGQVIYAGVDYEMILRQAEKEADVVLWDGGNNDLPFFKPDLHITLVDPHRPGHEVEYYPGGANLHLAQVLIIAKTGTAPKEGIEHVRKNIERYNPKAEVIDAESIVTVDNPDMVKGKKVLIVEDGPTLTHGEMSFGAGVVAAKKYGAGSIVDPRPYAIGSIKETFEKFTHLQEVLPAMGYSDEQMNELRETIDAVPCDLALIGTPVDLGRLLKVKHPLVRVTYELDEKSKQELKKIVGRFLEK